MSKLYTEEQVRIALDLSVKGIDLVLCDDIISYVKHIELPTDEEIIEESKIGGMDTAQGLCFQLGAKWMRDKIKGGEDE